MISKEGKKRIIMCAVVAIVFLLLGYMAGVYTTIKSVASIGASFLDEELVEQAIYMYEENIKNCFPIKL